MNNQICGICSNTNPIRELILTNCQHRFHLSCLMDCLHLTTTCPKCLNKLLEEKYEVMPQLIFPMRNVRPPSPTPPQIHRDKTMEIIYPK